MSFALTIATFSRTLPETWDGRHVRDQLFRSGTGVAANDRAACRARSRRDFIAKLGIVIEETDEALFWLVFAERALMVGVGDSKHLLREGRELLALFTRSAKTAAASETRARRHRTDGPS